MCDERERLLDYLYDACDADERRRVDSHLATCETCRAEISGLRALRLNLLAWDVPEHGSVWTPFAPARLRPWWREVPVWALAAAASVMFVVGLAGGLVSRALMPPPAATAQVAPTPGVSQAQLAVMEQRILAKMDQRLLPVAAHVQQASESLSRDQMMQDVEHLLSTSEERQNQALNRTLRAWLKDSGSFVRTSEFKNVVNIEMPQRVRYEVSQALEQQGGR